MHDIRFIRENPAAFDAALARRGLAPLSADILAQDEKSRALKTELHTTKGRFSFLLGLTRASSLNGLKKVKS